MKRACLILCATTFLATTGAPSGAAAQPAPAPVPPPPSTPGAVPATPPAQPAPPTAAQPPLPVRPLDLSTYTCQDMVQDMADRDLQRIGVAFVLSWALAQSKAAPDHLVFDLTKLTQFSGAVGRVCAGVDERPRMVTEVVAEQLGVLNGAK